MAARTGGRTNQRARTRKAILRAARIMLERGEQPTLAAIAEQAEVSRATAYRYFSGLDALLSEAAVEALVPEPEDIFGAGAPADPTARLLLVDDLFDRACREREVPLRLMLSRMLGRAALQPDAEVPLRQNRRVPMLEHALAPLAHLLNPKRRELLLDALAMIVGTEGFIALKDVVGLSAERSREVRRWAIETLLAAALEG